MKTITLLEIRESIRQAGGDPAGLSDAAASELLRSEIPWDFYEDLGDNSSAEQAVIDSITACFAAKGAALSAALLAKREALQWPPMVDLGRITQSNSPEYMQDYWVCRKGQTPDHTYPPSVVYFELTRETAECATWKPFRVFYKKTKSPTAATIAVIHTDSLGVSRREREWSDPVPYPDWIGDIILIMFDPAWRLAAEAWWKTWWNKGCPNVWASPSV